MKPFSRIASGAMMLAALARRMLAEHGNLLAAVLFGLAHYPNFGLMVATFLLALVCLQHYQEYRALAPLAVIHAVLGTLYLELASPTLLLSGAVGQRFFG